MSAARQLPHTTWRTGQSTHVTTSKQHRAYTIFMHPAVFIPSCVILGILFGFQEWTNYRRWGYHVGAAITLESWGMEYLVLGSLCWLIWRFLYRFIVKANVRDMLTWMFGLSIAFGIVKEMIWAPFFPNVPVDVPHMAYWQRVEFHWKANFIVSLWIFWCAFFLFRGVNYYQRYREKENAAAQLEVQLANAQLAALRMQLNPHFLFNAMNSISSLMRTDVNAADTMLEQLSSLLRISLERGNVQLIPLREEMEFIEVYLSMQDQRYFGRVRRDISIDSELHDALVPAMILQPIVENAYAHGLSKLERGGELFIEAHRQSSHVNFVITNSGLGLQSVPNGSSNGHGVGLANVRGRLHLHYGDNCSFKISQIDPTHVKVAIGLPFQLSDKAEIGMTRYGAQ
jgi:two-component system LytT family sensor kinase